jgi:hypothetical protein
MLHKVSSSYHELARLVPGLVGRASSSEHKKHLLLEMAARGETRPNRIRDPLGSCFFSYIKKSSSSYDHSFVRKLKKIAPAWMLFRSEFANQKKKQLLEMARKNCPKPDKYGPLGRALANYTQKSCHSHDPAFTKQIRRLAPHWFVSQSEVANEKKLKLTKIAKRGGPKPNWRSDPLGRALANYTKKSCHAYDPAFTKQIKKLAPHWFKRCSTR